MRHAHQKRGTELGGPWSAPGVAARVRCACGARYYVKAVSTHANPDTPGCTGKRRVLAALEPLITSRQLGKVGNYSQHAI